LGFFDKGSARYEFDLALPADPHRRGAAGLGAADEWCAPERFDESVARQPRVVSSDRRLSRGRISLRAAAVADHRGRQRYALVGPLGGLIGAFAVIAGLLFVDRVGAGAFAGLIITANILMSLAIDHFGWFNLPPHPMNIWRALGAVLMVGGVALISRF
jgi:hypothetical protein